jgi:RHS repeat-associated protein
LTATVSEQEANGATSINDDLDRLTDVTYHDSDTEAFVMDALGNRTGNQTLREDGTVNFTVDSLTNRYTSIGASSISHDDAGNLTVDKDGYQYTYDYENRVARIYKMDGQSEINVAQYVYDALGRRIGKWDAVASEATFCYYNDGWQVLAEYDYMGLVRNFVYGNYIDEPLVMNDGDNDYYYANDHLYSTAALLDDTGEVVERYEYDAYGTTHIMDASYNPRTESAYGNPYTFTGRHLDTLDNGNLHHMHYRHRDYDTNRGRFLQHDPLGVNPAGGPSNLFDTVLRQYTEGLNLYEYVLSSPLQYVDPLGTFSKGGWAVCAACGAAIGGEALGYAIGCGIGCKGGPEGCFGECMKDMWDGGNAVLPGNIQEGIGSLACTLCFGEIIVGEKKPCDPDDGEPGYDPDPPQVPKETPNIPFPVPPAEAPKIPLPKVADMEMILL